jgi:hypothetical protein
MIGLAKKEGVRVLVDPYYAMGFFWSSMITLPLACSASSKAVHVKP